MKIKTVVRILPTDFDERVNELLEEGYILEHRGLLPPDGSGLPAHYAQLVLLDPPAEPEAFDPFKALRQVQEFCLSIPMHTCRENCPLFPWCEQLGEAVDPTDWELPEVGG